MRKVILFEDSRSDAAAVQMSTRGVADVELLVLEDGYQGMRFINEAPFVPDLVLMDLNLPAISGKELLQEIRSSSALRHTPVVILSSSDSPEDIRDCMDLYANGYIKKQNTVPELREKLTVTFQYFFETIETLKA